MLLNIKSVLNINIIFIYEYICKNKFKLHVIFSWATLHVLGARTIERVYAIKMKDNNTSLQEISTKKLYLNTIHTVKRKIDFLTN